MTADTHGAFDRESAFDLLGAQRRLRSALLDQPTIRYRPARDLAAHMMLHLDDLPKCWSIATGWLRGELVCHRVDTGFGQPMAPEYLPGYAEAKAPDYDVPSFGGVAVDNRDPIMQAMWSGQRPVVFADMKQDRRVTPKLRRRLAGARTRSKFGAALRVRGHSFGLICADWTEHLAPNDSGLFDCFEQTVTDVLGPIIAVARQFSQGSARVAVPDAAGSTQLHDECGIAGLVAALTRSEIEVARLVAQGMSYKEIARIRDRSLSTIDHQLRSIRGKLGVASTASLVCLLARADDFKARHAVR